jgi:hypothetical protein
LTSRDRGALVYETGLVRRTLTKQKQVITVFVEHRVDDHMVGKLNRRPAR